MPRWTEQLDRVERFLDRIDGEGHGDLSREEYKDMLWSFFQHCWHLKDWIKNDPDLPDDVEPQDIEDAVKDSDALMLAADLANRTKHADLDWSRVEGDFGGAKISVSITENIGGGESTTTSEWDWEVKSDRGDDRWARDVAREAVDDWRQIISDLGLR